jgi:antitoxin ParD1/3/4
MRGMEEITIAVPTELAETIREAVRSGEYASPAVLIREALRARTCVREDADTATYFRKLVRDGLESGVAQQRRLFEEIKAEGLRRLAQLRRQPKRGT